MKAFAIGTSFVLGMMLATGCSSAIDDDQLSDEGGPELTEAVGSTQQLITKGKPGAVNGAANYCNTVNRCVQGEGDCDSSAECNAGLICAADNGPKFGFPSGYDVCVPSHCTSKTLDGDETGIDCGGSCGACSSCVGAPGAANFCSGCQCASGQGDCDSDAECASGLVCGANIGAKFGLPAGHDICVPAHCTNKTLDAASGETGIDVGGPCGAAPPSCGDGVVNGSEVCDDGVNDGVVCSPGCTSAVEIARILVNCDGGSSSAASLAGTDCISFPNAGASYILFQSGGASVTLYLNGDCTGQTRTTTTDLNFCGSAFDQGSNMNDNVRSAKIQHL